MQMIVIEYTVINMSFLPACSLTVSVGAPGHPTARQGKHIFLIKKCTSSAIL